MFISNRLRKKFAFCWTLRNFTVHRIVTTLTPFKKPKRSKKKKNKRQSLN
jgi:hypothetical protein